MLGARMQTSFQNDGSAPVDAGTALAREMLDCRLFAGDRLAQFVAAGMSHLQALDLIRLQYLGRKMTYAARYPEATDSIILAADGTPVGRVLLDRKPDRWRIVDIAILAAHRGRGLGTKSLRECQQRCRLAGVRLELQVAPLNPARRLYERLGFQVSGEDAVAVEMVWIAAKLARA
jgi:ribosomal protein S18 acetylase RimI-like enzyme